MKAEIIRFNREDEFETPERCHIFESYNKEEDEDLSIAHARVFPGVTTQLHHLKGVVERYLIIAGSGKVEIENLSVETVGPGDVVLIPENMAQRITNIGQYDLVFYCICTPRFHPSCYETLE